MAEEPIFKCAERLYRAFHWSLEKLCEKYKGRVSKLIEDVYSPFRDCTLADENGKPLARVWYEYDDSYTFSVKWEEYDF